MASYSQKLPPQAIPQPGGYGAPTTVGPGSGAPAGTFNPGTKIQVGGHRVIIQKYLSEGGFAHVYLVKMPKPVDGTDLAVLKRVAVADKDSLRSMRTEVETMKRLKGHRPIVTYIDSHASEMRGGGYEVFLLMEYCNGGGLIDFMNTRLQHRLTEPEILDIFADIAEGVACMHYLKPALLHRDLKVENVLITSRGSSKRFKLCDFGSSAAPSPAPTTVVECRLMDEDVQKHTTLQYRSPEMIDVYRKQPMNEKCDIWALGVLLYKLCYYTTPFEDQGQLAILNASYRFPSHPAFSNRLKAFIGVMLKEDMSARPNIYQVLKEACSMQGREVPIKDIYSGQSATPDKLSSRPDSAASKPSIVGASFAAQRENTESKVPDVVPMRRGRPTPSSTAPKPSTKVTSGDPFAALDSRPAAKGDVDDISSRFPSLDEFSLLHDQGNFDFDSTSRSRTGGQGDAKLGEKVTHRLADEVFASVRDSPPKASVPSRPLSVNPSAAHTRNAPSPAQVTAGRTPSRTDMGRPQATTSSNPDLKSVSSAPSTSRYVSTGTMTQTNVEDRPSRNVDRTYSATASRPSSHSKPLQQSPMPQPVNQRITAYQTPPVLQAQSSSSARASADLVRPQAEPTDSFLRPSDSVSRSRPASTNFESTTLDFLRENESTSRPASRLAQPSSWDSRKPSPSNMERTGSGAAYEIPKEPEQTKQSKRSSLGSLSQSKGMLVGKFSDAFKRFEGGQSEGKSSPSREVERFGLAPIAGSEATDGRSDDGWGQGEEEKMTPEMRREAERLQLEEEERRVETAAAEYRRRQATEGPEAALPRSIGGVPRAISIQKRVQNFVNEAQQAAPAQRSAEGYGKYSDAATSASKVQPEVPRKPLAVSKTRATLPTGAQKFSGNAVGGLPQRSSTVASGNPAASVAKPMPRPAAPKKPVHLNSLATGGRPVSPQKRNPPIGQEYIVATDLPGQPALAMSGREKEDYIEDFSKRFPSLRAMEGDGER